MAGALSDQVEVVKVIDILNGINALHIVLTCSPSIFFYELQKLAPNTFFHCEKLKNLLSHELPRGASDICSVGFRKIHWKVVSKETTLVRSTS